jgi:putative redox protein
VSHAPGDEIVGIDNARAIFQAARHPKSFVSLDGADHLLSRRSDAVYAAAVIAAWADRYLPAPSNRQPDTRSGEPPAVVVTDAGDGAFTQRIQVGGHTLTSDEPAAAGGDDLGPTPYDLLLAALGACTSMTVRMYAQRKNWPLRSTTVTLTHSKIHAADCESCETTSGRVDHIVREVRFDGDLDAAQRARLLEIANKCPVHRTLHSEVVVQTVTAEPEPHLAAA